MQTIYKYEVEITDSPVVKMPRNARILSFQSQRSHTYTRSIPPAEKLFIWALVETEEAPWPYCFLLRGTGHPFSADPKTPYIGSTQMMDGTLVLHLFGPL